MGLGNYVFVLINMRCFFVNFSPPWRKEGVRDILPVATDDAVIHPSNPAEPKHSLVQVLLSLSEPPPPEMMPKTQFTERLRRTQNLQSDRLSFRLSAVKTWLQKHATTTYQQMAHDCQITALPPSPHSHLRTFLNQSKTRRHEKFFRFCFIKDLK